MSRPRAVALAPAALLLASPSVMAALFGSLFAGSPPPTLGAAGGALAPCPGTPNCVSSRAADTGHAIAPLAFEGPADAAWRRLAEAIRATEGATIVREERIGAARYLHATYASRLMGFVDDLECLLPDGARAIDVRSASRLGRSDLGVNRARVEALRAAFAEPAR